MQIIRGDTKRYRFKRYDFNGNVIQTKATKVYFTMKKDPDCRVVLQKSLDNGITYDESSNYYYIKIDPKDTENLCFGSYGFDIEITQGKVVTTVCVNRLEILPEYTNKGDK